MTRMRSFLVVIVTFGGCLANEISRRAIFDCNRIDTTFCCTSRVRSLCAEQCKDVPCDSPDTKNENGNGFDGSRSQGMEARFHVEVMTTPFPMDPVNQFIPPPTAISIVHDGSAELLRPFVTPPPPPFTLTTTPFTQSPLSGFPTLIPFAPSIDDVQESRLVEGEFTNVPFIHSTIVKSMHHRGRTTPDPRIIKPPDSLVVIGDYDEYDTKAVSAGVQTTTPSVPADIANLFTRKPSIQSGGIALPKSSISEEVIPIRAESTPSTQTFPCALGSSRQRCEKQASPIITNRTTGDQYHRDGSTLRTPNVVSGPLTMRVFHRRAVRPLGWSVKVLPVQKIPTQSVGGEVAPHFAVDGDASTPDDAESQPAPRPLLKTFSIAPSKIKAITAGIPDFIEPRVIQFINHIRTTQPPYKMAFRTIRPSRPGWNPHGAPANARTRPTAPPPPQPQAHLKKPTRPESHRPQPPQVQQTCGVAPDFTPCVSSEEASHALLDCCRRKNLPAGCLSLCRYDITQAEVRSAMDRGQCGIFSVAPYLECASQGKDNSECCRFKGLAQKTGPQCEQFCRPAQGLTTLGLQHIVCGSAIGDMLQCHHAGIRRH